MIDINPFGKGDSGDRWPAIPADGEEIREGLVPEDLGRTAAMSISMTILGIYRDGKVELAERPEGLAESAPVLVTFVPEGTRIDLTTPAPSADEAKAARRTAGERLLKMLREGLDLGGPPYPRREELYDRHERFVGGTEPGDG